MSEQVVYRYTPRDGVFVNGVPQRDLTAQDVERLHPWNVRNGVDCGLYVPVEAVAETAVDQTASEPPAEVAEAANERRTRR